MIYIKKKKNVTRKFTPNNRISSRLNELEVRYFGKANRNVILKYYFRSNLSRLRDGENIKRGTYAKKTKTIFYNHIVKKKNWWREQVRRFVEKKMLYKPDEHVGIESSAEKFWTPVGNVPYFNEACSLAIIRS